MAFDWIENFAAERNLDRATGEVREATPALVRADGTDVGPLLEGEIEHGLNVTLCQVKAGRRHFLAVLTRVPETLAFAPALVCRDRNAFGSSPASLPAERWEEVRLESQAFDERFRLLVLAGQDPGWVRELFSPRMISWLAHETEPGFSWELNSGDLVVLLPAAANEADGAIADRLCDDAADLVVNIRTEAEEEGVDPDLFDESAELDGLEEALEDVPFAEPPAGVQDAVARFRRAASRKPSVLLRALTWAAIAAAPVIVLVSLFVGWAAALVAAVLVAIPAFWLGRLIAASRYRWGKVVVGRAGLEAFVRGYAGSRGFELQDRWAFHAGHRHIPFPGFADHVLFGRHPELDRDVHFLLLADAGEMRSRGVEIAYTAVRPYASNALLVSVDREPRQRELREAALPEGYRVSAVGREVLVWREIPGNLIRTGAGSDRFLSTAGAVILSLLGKNS